MSVRPRGRLSAGRRVEGLTITQREAHVAGQLSRAEEHGRFAARVADWGSGFVGPRSEHDVADLDERF